MQAPQEAHCPLSEVREFVAKVHGAALAEVPENAGARAFSAAFARLATANPGLQVAPPPAALGNLPVIEVAAQPGSEPSSIHSPSHVRRWRLGRTRSGHRRGSERDRHSSRWTRFPALLLDAAHPGQAWLPIPTGSFATIYRTSGKKRVLLIGYSQGADVLPFAVNRLPEATRAHVALIAIMGMSEHALFEFHVSSWISDDNSGPPTLPEVNRITGMPVLCIYGEDEQDSLCPKLDPHRFKVVKVKGGHHFDGDYAGSRSRSWLRRS